LFGIVKLSSFYIARIAVSMLSSSASFIMITFCKLDGAFKRPLRRAGGPNGGKGEADMDAFVGIVIAEELLLPP
jgi:hypothetical protein